MKRQKKSTPAQDKIATLRAELHELYRKVREQGHTPETTRRIDAIAHEIREEQEPAGGADLPGGVK